MKKFLITGLAAASAIAMAPAAMADDHMDGDTMVELNTQQQAMYDGWPATNRATYDAWPADVRTYYWTLTPVQMERWWMLDDTQRVAIYEMTPANRASTWASIDRQVNAQASANANTNAQANASTNSAIRYQSNAMVQQVPANRVAGEYPICQGDQQDSCIQPRAAGKNWGNRPLDYWPGRPASEMDGDS